MSSSDDSGALPSSPLLNRAGAVAADSPDNAVAAHYGSWVTEQRAFAAEAAVVDLSNRDVFAISGPDRLTWLHSLSSQHLANLPPNEPTEALILTPQGRIEHGFAGFDDGETFWGHTEPGASAELLDFLERMKFFSRVELAKVTDRVVIGTMSNAIPRYDLIDRSELEKLATDPEADSGVGVAGRWAWDAARIEAGWVRIGFDTDDRTIPNEVGLLERAVHLDKGCYRGQETVARVHTLGKPPRRLVRLMLDGSVDHLPALGSEFEVDGRVVGRVGTSARHRELGPIALALIKRSVDVSAQLIVDTVAASQEIVVDPNAGLHVRPLAQKNRVQNSIGS